MSRVEPRTDEKETSPQRFNFQTGRLSYRLRGSLDIELNDNVNVSENNPQSDVILWPKVGVDAFLPITERNAFDIGIGIGYQKFIRNEEYDEFYIAPKTHIKFKVLVGSIRLELYDEVSYVQDPTREGQVSGSAQYGGLENSAGIAATWEINERLKLSPGFDFFNFISSNDEFALLDRTTMSFPVNLSYLFSERVSAGVQMFPARTDYKLPILTPHWQISGGIYAKVHLTENLSIRPEIGVSSFFFDRPTPSGVEQSQFLYGSVEIEHSINERWRYSLSFGKETTQGMFASLQEMIQSRLKVTWRASDHIVVRPTVFWEDSQNEVGRFGENYWRIGLEPRVEFHWLKNWSLSASYRFTMKRSDRQLRNYEQNRFLIAASYTF